MRKRKLRLAIAILLLAVLSGLAWLIFSSLGPREPVYQGTRLSEWLKLANDEKINESLILVGKTRPAVALAQIGTNAIPTLLRMLRAHDSKFKINLMGLAEKQHLIKINFVPASTQNKEAGAGFTLLGAAASNAVPALIQIYEENVSEFSQLATADALAAIGPAATKAGPTLLRVVADTNSSEHVRANAATALSSIQPDPQITVPILVKCLKDADPTVRQSSTWALENLGNNAKAAVPALFDLLKDPDASVVRQAEQALLAIDFEAATKAGLKRNFVIGF